MHNLARIFGRSALVVKEVKVREMDNMQVKIVARKAGLTSWFLSLLGIDSTFTLWIYKDRIESMEGSLSGRIKTVVPLTALDTYTCGFTKPIQFFVFAAAAIVFAIFQCFGGVPGGFVFVTLMLAVCFFVAYFLMKCLLLSFTTNGGNGIVFLFKRSIIEGVNVDETFAERVGEIVKRNYVEQVKR